MSVSFGEQVRAAFLRILETDECESYFCSARIPIGAEQCVAHASEARSATDRLVMEIQMWLAGCEPEIEEQ